jgi:hypothetical protein
VFSVTVFISLPGNGFQRLTLPSLRVPELSPASATSFWILNCNFQLTVCGPSLDRNVGNKYTSLHDVASWKKNAVVMLSFVCELCLRTPGSSPRHVSLVWVHWLASSDAFEHKRNLNVEHMWVLFNSYVLYHPGMFVRQFCVFFEGKYVHVYLSINLIRLHSVLWFNLFT